MQERDAGGFLEGAPGIVDVLRHAVMGNHRFIRRLPYLAKQVRVAGAAFGQRKLALDRDHVDIVVRGDDLADFGEFGEPARQSGAGIERVAGRDAGIDQAGERLLRRPGKGGHFNAGPVGDIEEQTLGAARISDHRDTVPGRQPARRKRERGFDQLVQGIDQDDTVFAAHRGEDVIVGGQGAGMALRGLLPARRTPHFQHQDRLAGIERPFRRRHQCIRPAHALGHAGDYLCMTVIDQEIYVIGHVEVQLVSAGDGIGIAEPARGTLFEPELERPARLKHDADRSGRQTADPRRGVEQQAFGQGNRPHAVGARYAQTRTVAYFAEGSGARGADFVAAFAESRGKDQRIAEPGIRRLRHYLRDRLRRDDDDCEVDLFGQGSEIRIHLLAP